MLHNDNNTASKSTIPDSLHWPDISISNNAPSKSPKKSPGLSTETNAANSRFELVGRFLNSVWEYLWPTTFEAKVERAARVFLLVLVPCFMAYDYLPKIVTDKVSDKVSDVVGSLKRYLWSLCTEKFRAIILGFRAIILGSNLFQMLQNTSPRAQLTYVAVSLNLGIEIGKRIAKVGQYTKISKFIM